MGDDDYQDPDPRFHNVGYGRYQWEYEREAYDERQRIFKSTCGKIKQNDPALDKFVPEIQLNDRTARTLGKALFGNTELRTLTVKLMGEERFTSRGAQAFVRGILGSQIKQLGIQATDELPIEMSQLGVPSLETIVICHPCGDDFVVQLCESLMESKLLKGFGIWVDLITPRGAQAISNLFCVAQHITDVAFKSGTAALTMETMQTLFMEGVQRSQRIDNLLLDGIVGDMQALASTIPKLRILTIKSVDVTVSEVEILAHALRETTNQLVGLHLTNCGLTDTHMSVLLPIVGTHPFIRSVGLDNNKIGDAGITSFVDHWISASIIEELKFSSNNIGFRGAQLLISAAAHHSSLMSLLDLNSNASIGFDGLQLIGEALHNVKLKTLVLDNVVKWITYCDDNCDAVVKQEAKRKSAGNALLQGVRDNHHFLQVGLANSHLPTIVLEEISFYAKANRCGRRAVFEHQYRLPRGVWSHFLAKKRMSSSISLMYLFLQELPSCGIIVQNEEMPGVIQYTVLGDVISL